METSIIKTVFGNWCVVFVVVWDAFRFITLPVKICLVLVLGALVTTFTSTATTTAAETTVIVIIATRSTIALTTIIVPSFTDVDGFPDFFVCCPCFELLMTYLSFLADRE